ncbi:hypothetical protein DPMN_070502 [Dreissena polymorpha]|uniref:Uncharacterized protein n=1 Tax=Dreissena polymorpha TaxID=45954 RepID=A0A9D4BX76_DREPO|nr:hypothetical protein DPMN_070502 [Dreissena polymorpha]
MSTIRTAARRHVGLDWKAYDQQFRLRLAVDPTGTRFDTIDYKLWLLYVGPCMQGAIAERVMIRKCYDFNYSRCSRDPCPYRQSCLSCSGNHPSNMCRYAFSGVQVQGKRGFLPGRAPVSQGPRLAGFRPGFRPRHPKANLSLDLSLG